MKLKHKKTPFAWPEWTLIGIICTSIMMVLLSFCVAALQAPPKERAQAELARIAKDYYISYLYPHLLGTLEADPAERLEPYIENGIPVIYLRHLLHYNNDEYAASASVFEQLQCNTNHTGVRYQPIEPYGPYDFEIQYVWSCDAVDFDEAK